MESSKQSTVKRAASPQEIADTILFLACKAPFLTSQSIVVDGGTVSAPVIKTTVI
jgi:NAD(P)-dependent dehydrogenase (short-subunit alcohol dehydrogenase family)